MYVKEHDRYICVKKFQVDILKMTEYWYFEGRKRPLFTLFPGFSAFYDSQILSDLIRSKVL